jgi:hypothetical protein
MKERILSSEADYSSENQATFRYLSRPNANFFSSQQAATGRYPEPYESSPYFHILCGSILLSFTKQTACVY